MSDFAGSAMIALLPTTVDWCHIELPHMTLVFAGDVFNLRPSAQNELGKLAVNIAMKYPSITLPVLGVEVFGNTVSEQVEVLVLRQDPILRAMRQEVESWNASEHPFTPHATIGPIGSAADEDIPFSLTFDRVAVGWGDDLISYGLL